MKDDTRFDLLKDLSLLAKKYGPEVFAELAEYLRQPQNAAAFVTLLEQLQAAAQSRGNPKRKPRGAAAATENTSDRELRIFVERQEPDKSALLIPFLDGLRAGRILPVLRSLRNFASELSATDLTGAPRGETITVLIRALVALPIEDLANAISQANIAGPASDRSLDGWAEVIMRGGRKPYPPS